MAIEVLGELSNHHQISIITARPLLFHDVTIDWLEHYGVKYHNITFTENKLEECINSKIHVLIDDAPHYATEFANRNMPVILFEQPYNISVNADLVYRTANWFEISGLIAELETKNIATGF